MKAVLPVDSDYILYLLILHTQYAMFKARNKELREIGITPEEAGILFHTCYINAKEGYATPGKIARRVFREPHSISAIINRMVKRGLLITNKDLDRKTMVRVTLTEKGQQAYERSILRKPIYTIISVLSPEEHLQLESCLKKLLCESVGKLDLGIKISQLLPTIATNDNVENTQG